MNVLTVDSFSDPSDAGKLARLQLLAEVAYNAESGEGDLDAANLLWYLDQIERGDVEAINNYLWALICYKPCLESLWDGLEEADAILLESTGVGLQEWQARQKAEDERAKLAAAIPSKNTVKGPAKSI